MADIGVLGPVSVVDHGCEVPLGGVKPRAVLSHLAMHAGRIVGVSDLIDAVWGEEPPDTATNTLQVHVSALRRALTPCGVGIERSAGGYRLDVPARAVDLHRFELLAAEGRAALRGERPERARDLLGQALGLWRGRPFEGLDGVAFVQSARPAIENVHDSAAIDFAHCLTELGRYDEAIVAAERLVARLPYDERAWGVALVAYYWAGRPNDALQAFQRARTALGDELGLEPGPELVALELAVLDHTLPPPTSARASSSTGVATPILPQTSPLVGRGEIAERLVEAFASGSRLVSLVGLGGIGKTSLATHVGHRIAESGVSVGFVDLSATVDAASAREEVRSTLGELLGASDRARGTDVDAGWSLAILDNLEQIVDAGDLVSSLLDGHPSVRLLVTSRRPVRLRDERIVGVPGLRVRESDGSTGAAVDLFRRRAALVGSDLDGVGPDVVSEICDLVAGIPLGIELAARQLRAVTPAALLERLRSYQLSALDVAAPADAPARQRSLGAVLESTVASLSEAGRSVLAVLAFIEGPVTVELIERAVSDPTGVLDAIGNVIECGLAVRLEGGDRIQAPVPVRQHVMSAMTDDELASTGDGLAAAVGDLIAAADGHWYDAEADAHRARLSADAGAIDAVVRDLRDRAGFAELAIMSLSLAPFWLQQSRLVDALATLDSIPHAELEPVLAARVCVLRGTFASYLNRDDTSVLLEGALDSCRRVGIPPERLIVNGWCCLGAFYANHDREDDVRRCVALAGDAANESEDPMLVALARDFAGFAASSLGDDETAIRLMFDAIGDARRQGDRYALVLLLASVTEALLRDDRIDEADIFISEAFELARTVDLGPALIWVLLMVGATQVAQDRPAAAWGSLTEQLRSMIDRYPDPVMEADTLSLLAAVHAMNGDDVAAARTWGASAALHEDSGVASDRRRIPIAQHWWGVVRERMGSSRFDALQIVGSADPQRLIHDLLADEPAISETMS